MRQYKITSRDIIGDLDKLTIPDALLPEDDPVRQMIGSSTNPIAKQIQQTINDIQNKNGE
jgi:hypothetical protein